MDFEYLNYVTSTKLKKVNDKNVKPVSHFILKISFLTLFNHIFHLRPKQIKNLVKPWAVQLYISKLLECIWITSTNVPGRPEN